MPKGYEYQEEKFKQEQKKLTNLLGEFVVATEAEKYTPENMDKVLAKLHSQGRNIYGISMGEVLAIIDQHYNSKGKLNFFATSQELEAYYNFVNNNQIIK